ERMPALPQPAQAAPRVSRVWDLRGPRGTRTARPRRARARPRARVGRGTRTSSESPQRSPAALATEQREPALRVAVDCNGADLGPGEVAAGAALAARDGARTILFGPAAELRRAVAEAPPGAIEVVHAPASIAKSPDPAGAARKCTQ